MKGQPDRVKVTTFHPFALPKASSALNQCVACESPTIAIVLVAALSAAPSSQAARWLLRRLIGNPEKPPPCSGESPRRVRRGEAQVRRHSGNCWHA